MKSIIFILISAFYFANCFGNSKVFSNDTISISKVRCSTLEIEIGGASFLGSTLKLRNTVRLNSFVFFLNTGLGGHLGVYRPAHFIFGNDLGIGAKLNSNQLVSLKVGYFGIVDSQNITSVSREEYFNEIGVDANYYRHGLEFVYSCAMEYRVSKRRVDIAFSIGGVASYFYLSKLGIAPTLGLTFGYQL